MLINIAIVGLGRVGSILLQQILNFEERGIKIVAVAEIAETPGKLLAREKKIKIDSLDAIINMGKQVDIIFELTGKYEVRQEVRHKLMDIKNYHTVIAPETIATLICMMFTDKKLPNVHAHKGY